MNPQKLAHVLLGYAIQVHLIPEPGEHGRNVRRVAVEATAGTEVSERSLAAVGRGELTATML
jgi:hypothetical protein